MFFTILHEKLKVQKDLMSAVMKKIRVLNIMIIGIKNQDKFQKF